MFVIPPGNERIKGTQKILRNRTMSTITQELPVKETGQVESTGSLQLVSFRLDQEEYGIEITKVQEIILIGEITRVPQAPDFIKGLINLRSTVIPIVDLRLRFNLNQQAQSDETRIMVVNVAGKTIGIIVDAVNEVLRISNDQIAPPPPTVAGLGREYLTGLVKLDKRLLILLDIDKILDEQATAAVNAAAGAKLSEQTGAAMEKIIQGVEGTANKISEIATVTVEQAQNANAIQQVSSVTEESAAASEEMASSSEELGTQATSMGDLVARFKVE